MLTIILTIFTAISAILHIRAEYYGPNRNIYIFKPLTVVFIILIALQVEEPVSVVYRQIIIAGLIFSLIGDIFLMLPKDRFIAGLISFLTAHLLYIIAFTIEGNGFFSFWGLIPFLVYAVIMLRILLPYLGKMKIPVIVYMLVILLMGWQAFNLWLGTKAEGNLFACVGAVLFMISDSILAVNRFRGYFHNAQFYILSTYFTAQYLIALSV